MTISNLDDIIDSRDVIERIEELTAERDDWIEEELDGETGPFDYNPNPVSVAADAWAGEYTEEAAELSSLESLAEEADGYAEDWQYGEALIRYSYFTEYCMQLLSDIGDLPAEIPHYIVIDEEATADNLKVDYTTVDFDGVDYYIR